LDCKSLKVRLDKLIQDRKVVEEQWDLIQQFVVPYRGNFFRDVQSEGAVEWRQSRQVFDATAMNANNILSSSLHGSITNPSHQWFNFRFRRDDLSENREAAQWLRDCTQICFETIRDSNFNLEANEGYIDLTSYGTAFMSKEILETNGSFEDYLFAAAPIEESYFEVDFRGLVHRYYRKMKWSAVQLSTKFGREKIPEKYRDMVDKPQGTEANIEIVLCVYQREGQHDPTKVAAPINRPVGFKYFLYEGGEAIGEEGGYYSMPTLVMRWRNTAGSVWGNSPAMIALPDILTLNQLVELILESLEKVVDPAIKTTERGLISDLDLSAAGVNVVRNMQDLEAFETKARFDVAELNREKLQASIRSIFYVDQLELKDSPAMTATEVSVRYELMQRLLGPTLGRLESDFLDPLVTSTFADLVRYKRLPDMPAVVQDSRDPTVNVEYTGPMARAQKLDQAQSLTQFLGAVAQMGEVNPQALEKVDWDQSVSLMAEYYGAEPKVLVSEAEMKKKRREQAQLGARAGEAEVSKLEGDAQQANEE